MEGIEFSHIRKMWVALGRFVPAIVWAMPRKRITSGLKEIGVIVFGEIDVKFSLFLNNAYV